MKLECVRAAMFSTDVDLQSFKLYVFFRSLDAIFSNMFCRLMIFAFNIIIGNRG